MIISAPATLYCLPICLPAITMRYGAAGVDALTPGIWPGITIAMDALSGRVGHLKRWRRTRAHPFPMGSDCKPTPAPNRRVTTGSAPRHTFCQLCLSEFTRRDFGL